MNWRWITGMLNSLLGLILFAWISYIYAFWWGWIDRNKYNVKGPLNSALVVFGVPLGCVFLIGLLNRRAKKKGKQV